MVNREALIACLNRRIELALRPLIPRDHPVALLDFPSHMNVGDSAIWLGETEYLRRNRNRIVYVCDPWSYSRHEAERRIGEAVILITGGGNFGDLYPASQSLRERVVADFPDRRIVQLPQTIWFASKARAERAGAVLNAHPDLTLMVRDTRSLKLAELHFDARAVLCPDMAFALGSLPSPSSPVKEIVWLARSDIESATPAIPAGPKIEVLDWLGTELGGAKFPSASIVLRRAILRVGSTARRRPRRLRGVLPQGLGLYHLHARGRLTYGCEVLQRGRAVVTDRLHGHVLSTLLGIPHALLDNKYGKLETFHSTWTRDLDLVRWAHCPGEAMRLATELAAESPSSPSQS